jgi:hypothetical protein
MILRERLQQNLQQNLQQELQQRLHQILNKRHKTLRIYEILHGWNMHNKQGIFQQVLIIQQELQHKTQISNNSRGYYADNLLN